MRFALLLLIVLAPQDSSTSQERKDFVEKKVDGAISSGLKALEMMQKPSGRFEWYGRAQYGATGLALYTMLASGGSIHDPPAAKALDWLLKNPFPWGQRGDWDTYEISLVAVALSFAIPQMPLSASRDRALSLLQRAADWLVSAQWKGGGWSYTSKPETHDHSNSQFGIMGLRAAVNAGVKITTPVWEREVNHWKTAQLKDGGWGYHACYKDQTATGRSTSTMTAAGVMCLAMSLASSPKEKAPEDLAKDANIARGLLAMRSHWDRSMGRSAPINFYLLYSVERACMVTGTRLLGDLDWYVEGSWALLHAQDPDGLWALGQDQVKDQCFALLFLKRAYVPVRTPSNAKPADPVSPAPPPLPPGRPREME
jgi:hypothetical protein